MRFFMKTVPAVSVGLMAASALGYQALSQNEAGKESSGILLQDAREIRSLDGKSIIGSATASDDARGGGVATRSVRRQLAEVVDRLVELPGRRGAGDFGRSDGVVTNLEFDTPLALLRCAIGLGSERAWQLALRSLSRSQLALRSRSRSQSLSQLQLA